MTYICPVKPHTDTFVLPLKIRLKTGLKTPLLTLLLIALSSFSFGQSYGPIIHDRRHLAVINQNASARLLAEQTHHDMLRGVRGRIDDIQVNLTSMALVQQLIYRSLAEVDQALKSGRAARQISRLVQQIIAHSTKMLQAAKGEPWLLLFAERIAVELKERGLNLAIEVSDFVLGERKDVLMDYQTRDQLLRHIVLELKVIRALVFSMERSMYYAKAGGLLNAINPYRTFINKDKRKADDILRHYRRR